MKLFGMALYKLTFSIGLLAASLMLSAPAQAETWSCSYMEKDRRVENIIFVRKGDSFRQVGQYKGRIEKIHVETDDVIHLYRFMDMVFDKSAKVVTVLNKKHEAFMQVTASTTTLKHYFKKGRCTVH